MPTNPTPKVPGRLLAWTALLVALVASVAANVAFAYPAWGPRLSAGVAPLLVVLAAGLLERVPLGGIKVWRRLLAYGGLGVVVVAAFVTSFEHQYRLLVQYGNPALSAVLLPVAVDGLIVLASVCLTVIAERRRELAAVTAVATVATQPAEQGVLQQQRQNAAAPSGLGMHQMQRHLGADVHVNGGGQHPASDLGRVHMDTGASTDTGGQLGAGSLLIGETPEMSQTQRPQPAGTRNPAGQAGARSTKIGAGSARGTEPRNGTRPAARQVESTADLTEAARTVAGELAAAGRKVSRDALAAGLRARGHRVGTDRAADLARTLAAVQT